jgi:hypothetical protein
MPDQKAINRFLLQDSMSAALLLKLIGFILLTGTKTLDLIDSHIKLVRVRSQDRQFISRLIKFAMKDRMLSINTSLFEGL